LAPEKDQLRFVIEPLGERHNRAAFSCGVEALDAYLRTQASQDLKKRAAATFVATADGTTIGGCYTLSQYSVRLADVPDAIAKKLAKYPHVPTTLLGRLARSNDLRGHGIGEILLMDALRRSLDLSKQAASTGMIVDAKDEWAAVFYRKYGFLDLPNVDRRLFLPMGTIEKLFPPEVTGL
jgi:predicted GNAT family N-acyltransferase